MTRDELQDEARRTLENLLQYPSLQKRTSHLTDDLETLKSAFLRFYRLGIDEGLKRAADGVKPSEGPLEGRQLT